MVILGVDHGLQRSGVAVSDKLEMLASPIGTVNENDNERLSDKIAEYAKEYRAELIVMGLPLNMDGTEGDRCDETRAFGALLSEKTGLEVVFEDERLTTVSAHAYLSNVNVRGKKRKNVVDTVSAVIILEDFLRKRKNAR